MGLLSAKQQQAPSAPSTPDPRTELRDAHAVYSGMQAAHEVARLKFVHAGTPEAEKGLLEAEDNLRRAERWLSRANERVRQAERAAAEAKRAELEQKRDRLCAELANANLEKLRQPLAEKEVAALLAFIEIRAKRHELELQILQKQCDLDSVNSKLGQELPYRRSDPVTPPIAIVVDRLNAYARALPQRDLRRFVAENAGHNLLRGER